jgi:F-type H+-transporting ATPase subunit delta
MRNKVIVTRYAEAFVSFLLPRVGMLSVIEEARNLKSLLREHPEFGVFLETPQISLVDKARVIERVMAGSFLRETRDFINYLISKRRINIITGVVDYIRQAYAHGNVVDALLQTTFPLEADIIEQIKNAVFRQYNKNVNLYIGIDPQLLGGVRLQIGNRVIDGSVRHKLDDLKKQMLKAQVV